MHPAAESPYTASTPIRLAWAVGVLAAVLLGPTASSSEQTLYEQTLIASQIRPDFGGLRRYLRGLHPSREQTSLAQKLIAQLGSASYAEREAATAKLLVMPALPVELLVRANQMDHDPEIRWRTRSILETGREQRATTLFAALKIIQLGQIQGLAGEVVSVFPLCGKEHQRSAAFQALRATSSVEDANLLRDVLKSEDAGLRMAAVEALSATLESQAEADFLQILRDDQSDRVKLAAARALADLGQRRSLAYLVELLDSDDLVVRVRSSETLRYLTGHHFGFAAYDQHERREIVAQKWRQWLAANGNWAELRFPLDEMDASYGFLHGNMLLAFGYKNNVAEYDPSGKEVWSYPAKGAWSAEKLSNGNVLIAAYNENRVIEVNGGGEVVWDYPAAGVLNARPLDTGNIIVSLHSPKKVLEINRGKKVVWEMATAGSCCDAHKLESGNVIFCAGESVVEVSPDRKTLWQYDCAGQPYGIQPLKNGNVLICILSGNVLEVNRDKKVVWEFSEPNAVDAFRLPNGNTLITGSKRFLEVTPDKQTVWSKDGCNYGSARR